jgi:hypothetical protein
MIKNHELVDSKMFKNEANGDITEILIEGYVKYHNEVYGADADGHRGVKKTIVDDVDDVMAFDVDRNLIKLNKEENEEAAKILTEKFLEG